MSLRGGWNCLFAFELMRAVTNRRNATQVRRGRSRLPANVKLLGLTSLVNDIASEMIYPLLPDL